MVVFVSRKMDDGKSQQPECTPCSLQVPPSHCPTPQACQFSPFLQHRNWFHPCKVFRFCLFLFLFPPLNIFVPLLITLHHVNTRNLAAPEARFCYVNYSSPSSFGAVWSSTSQQPQWKTDHRHGAALSQAAAPRATPRN